MKAELKKVGFKVTTPDFPNTENPKLTEWLQYFKKQVSVNSGTILIGHSLGVSFILRFLEAFTGKKAIKAAFLVSGFERSLGTPETDNFVVKPFNWQKIKAACRKFVVINSDNDPYVPLSKAKDLAANLGTKVILIKNGGHLNEKAGYTRFELLLERVKGMI